MIEAGLKPALEDGTAVGIGLWEITLSQSEEFNTDHAAKWETSDMMFFYPDQVDMSTLGDDEMILDMRAPWGIGGLDPREHASVEVGRRNVELASDALGEKAKEMLVSLPEDQRNFNMESLIPDNWWMV